VGIQASQAPEEYQRQCWLGVANAVRLANGFATEGFSSVIEGLENNCRPGTGWIERTFPVHSVCAVAVVCAEAVLSERWRQRGWDNRLSPEVLDELRWYRENSSLFACLVDTTEHPPEQTVELLYGCCPG
jgi:hypothetical protein